MDDMDEISKLKSFLNQHFKMKDLGRLNYFLDLGTNIFSFR